MVGQSPFPTHMPVLPPPIIKSLEIKDDLTPQREQARALLFQANALKNDYSINGHHPAVTPEMAEWAVRRTDHTTLRPTRNEPDDFMRRMAFEATNPWPMRSVTTWPDYKNGPYTDKLTPLIEELAAHPKVGITLVLGYPHGFSSANEASRTIDHWGKTLRDVKNPVDIDTVINYVAWMDGDRKLVGDILRAEGEAARQNGLTWKSIQKVSVHAYASRNVNYGGDFFRSVYDSTRLALEAGADCAKTSTGVAARAPYNYFVPADTGVIARALPMLTGVADFNRETGEQRWPKFSGGNTNEADAAVARIASLALLGPEVAEKIVFGTSYRFRLQLLKFIALSTGDKCPFDVDKILTPYGIDVGALRPEQRGFTLAPQQLAAPGG